MARFLARVPARPQLASRCAKPRPWQACDAQGCSTYADSDTYASLLDLCHAADAVPGKAMAALDRHGLDGLWRAFLCPLECPSAPLGPNIESCAGSGNMTRCFLKPPPGEFSDDVFGGYFHLCVNTTSAPVASQHRYVMQQQVEAGAKASGGVREFCEPGFFQDLAQQPTCKGCPAGYHADQLHSVSCKPCPAGWYSLDEQAHCTGCPAGWFQQNTEKSSCFDCGSTAQFCPERSTYPVAATPGYYTTPQVLESVTGEALKAQLALIGKTLVPPSQVEHYRSGDAWKQWHELPENEIRQDLAKTREAQTKCEIGTYHLLLRASRQPNSWCRRRRHCRRAPCPMHRLLSECSAVPR